MSIAPKAVHLVCFPFLLLFFLPAVFHQCAHTALILSIPLHFKIPSSRIRSTTGGVYSVSISPSCWSCHRGPQRRTLLDRPPSVPRDTSMVEKWVSVITPPTGSRTRLIHVQPFLLERYQRVSFLLDCIERRCSHLRRHRRAIQAIGTHPPQDSARHTVRG